MSSLPSPPKFVPAYVCCKKPDRTQRVGAFGSVTLMPGWPVVDETEIQQHYLRRDALKSLLNEIQRSSKDNLRIGNDCFRWAGLIAHKTCGVFQFSHDSSLLSSSLPAPNLS